MMVLPLQATLLYWLHRAILGDCEEEAGGFTHFLQIDRTPLYFWVHSNPTISLLTNSSWRKIPLQKKRNTPVVLYISAMPQRLLSSRNLLPLLASFKSIEEPSTESSQQMVDRLKRFRSHSIKGERDHKGGDRTLLCQLWHEFQIETQRPGWLAFRLSDHGICLWLNQLFRLRCDDNFMPAVVQSNLSDVASFATATSVTAISATATFTDSACQPASLEPALWQVQYTHARCCTLLRLWKQTHPEFADPVMTAANAPAFDLATLLGMTPHVSAALIHSLIETADDLFWIPYRSPSQQYFLLLKRAGQLCQLFEAFYSTRLSGFGRLCPSSPCESGAAAIGEFQSGFYLATATKNVLELLLCRYLGAAAPAEI